jgi:hypothetical protein
MGWDACTQDPNWIIRQIECHPGSASWVQAVFSVVAIVAAVWLARQDGRRRQMDEAADRRRRASTLALRLFPYVVRLENSLQQIGRINVHQDFGLATALKNPEAAIHAFTIPTLGERTFFADLAFLEMDVSADVAKLINMTDDYASFVVEAIPRLSVAPEAEYSVYKSYMARKIAAIRAVLDSLRPKLEALMQANWT